MYKDFEMSKPTKQEAMEAVEILLKWAGDDPKRFGLQDTPRRVVEAFEEYFQDKQDPVKELSKTFDDITEYKGPVIIREISF